MYYCLNKDVFLVKGKAKDAIYDLSIGKLYHLKKSETLILDTVLGAKENLNFSDKEIAAISELTKLNLLVKKSEPETDSIYSHFVKPHINFAWIEICTACNLKCKHCYNESSPKSNVYLSFDDFKAICMQLKSVGIEKVQLIGGEPFCHKNILVMLEYASSLFSFVEVFTNGTLINLETCKFLKEKEIRVALSVYSYISSEHDKVTTLAGSHQKTCKTIENLKNLGVTYRIATTHMKGICIGEKSTELYSLHPYKDIVRLSGRADLNLLTRELLKQKLITKKSFHSKLNKTRVFENLKINHCFGKKLYVSANLDVYPCAMERRFSHGNLRNGELKDILKDSICYMTKDFVDECKDCELRYACYDCRPDSVSDSIFEKPYYCTYKVATGEWADEDSFVETFFDKYKINESE